MNNVFALNEEFILSGIKTMRNIAVKTNSKILEFIS